MVGIQESVEFRRIYLPHSRRLLSPSKNHTSRRMLVNFNWPTTVTPTPCVVDKYVSN